MILDIGSMAPGASTCTVREPSALPDDLPRDPTASVDEIAAPVAA
jgi:hypothetical protein